MLRVGQWNFNYYERFLFRGEIMVQQNFMGYPRTSAHSASLVVVIKSDILQPLSVSVYR